METSTSKLKIRHVWNQAGCIAIKYDTPSGKAVMYKDSDWYFAVNKFDYEKVKKLLAKSKKITVDLDKKFPNFAIVKLDITTYEDSIRKYKLVKKLEDRGIETFEGDLPSDRRWCIDADVEISDNVDKLYFDIETDDTEKLEVGKHRILSFSAIDSNCVVYFKVLSSFTDEAEKVLLHDVMQVFSKYDAIIGWNSSNFDIPYIKARLKMYKMDQGNTWSWKTFGSIDLLKRFRHIFRFDTYLKSYSLDSISNHFLGHGKIQHKQQITEMWKHDQTLLKKYNIEDAMLVKELDEKLGITAMMLKQSQWCGVPLAHFGLYSCIDSYIMKTAHKIGKFCKTSINAIDERTVDKSRIHENPGETETIKTAQYAGAIVLEPKIGLYDNTYVFDFKGLYPSLMRTSNIGYDSLTNEEDDDYIVNPGTCNFARKTGEIKPTLFKKEKSVINLAITQLITLRNDYKILKNKLIAEHKNSGPYWERVMSDEIIVKELANSTYGIMGLQYGRYFSLDIAESITLFGQWCITFAKKFFEDQGFSVLYGDTDSVFVYAKGNTLDIDSELKLFHAKLKEELLIKYNIDESFIQLNFDKLYKKFLLIKKKIYAGQIINMEGHSVDQLYARGFYFIKRNSFSFAAQKQKELLDNLFNKNYTIEQVKKFIADAKIEFFAKDFTKQELTLTAKVNKLFNEYTGKTPPLHVRLAKIRNEKTGEKMYKREIEYIITSRSPVLDGVLADEYAGNYDKYYYWENQTLPALEVITNIVIAKPKQLTLF